MIHQPHFLPWPGYVARCLAADTVILLDNVKFKRSHFQHRTKFLNRNTVESWLTLPIDHATWSQRIDRVTISEPFDMRGWQGRFADAYGRQPYFLPVWEEVASLIQNGVPQLSDVTVGTLMYILQALRSSAGVGIPEVKLASAMQVSEDRTSRLADICAARGITHLVMGRDALQCHDCHLLVDSGVALLRHVYHGSSSNAPRPGVTVLDGVFRFGFGRVAERLKKDWRLEPATAG
jgi:hypothetical protein